MKNINIAYVYSHLEDIISNALSGNSEELEVLKETIHRVSDNQKGFWSSSAPGSDRINYIAFIGYAGELYFYTETVDAAYSIRELEDPEDVFTPAVYDIENGRLALPEDIKKKAGH